MYSHPALDVLTQLTECIDNSLVRRALDIFLQDFFSFFLIARERSLSIQGTGSCELTLTTK